MRRELSAGALVMHARVRPAVGMLIWGALAMVMACVWLFSDPFKTGRPISTMNDMITVIVVALALHGWFIWKNWPLIFVVMLEAFLIIRYYRSNRPKGR